MLHIHLLTKPVTQFIFSDFYFHLRELSDYVPLGIFSTNFDRNLLSIVWFTLIVTISFHFLVIIQHHIVQIYFLFPESRFSPLLFHP